MINGNRITHLSSGGIITNYQCTSRCRHCLYKSSPRRSRDYIDGETLRGVLDKIKSLGCRSLHIGGGEPFLDRKKLLAAVKVFIECGVSIDYIETNSSWCRDASDAAEFLRELKAEGVGTILVSISPFHNEFIPFAKVEAVREGARRADVAVFPWVEEFAGEIKSFDTSRPHPLSEYEERFGPGYLSAIPHRYWVTLRGRALETYTPFMEKIPLAHILEKSAPCRELFDVSHFHVDLYGNYLPGLCAGFAVPIDDLPPAFSPPARPLLSLLAEQGIAAFYGHARAAYGFSAAETYTGKCALCVDIRTFLIMRAGIRSPELAPVEFYQTD